MVGADWPIDRIATASQRRDISASSVVILLIAKPYERNRVTDSLDLEFEMEHITLS